MTRTAFLAGALVLALLSGLTLYLPVAHAQSVVTVSIPLGAVKPSNAPGYAPANVTVMIGVNNTVTWTNDDTAPHTVTPSNLPPGATWSVGSGNMNAGAVYTFTFTVPGTYTYTCAYHAWMSGTVIVKPAATSTTTLSKPSTTVSTPASTTSVTTTKTTTTPEFPIAWLAAILFAVIAAVMLAAPRLMRGRMSPLAPR